jgi:apolipoprotein N-acyltransferase
MKEPGNIREFNLAILYKESRRLVAILFSAIFYSFALFDINNLFYLSAPSLIILLVVILKSDIKKNALLACFVWLPIVVFAHYVWFFYMLNTKLGASIAWSVMLYCALSLIHLLCFGLFIYTAFAVWCFINRMVCLSRYQAVFFILTFVSSFEVAGLMLMFILDAQGAYSVIGPVIPLSKFFMQPSAPIDVFFNKNANKLYSAEELNEISFLKIIKNVSHNSNMWNVGQNLFHAMQQASPGGIVVTPESFISCPLNHESEFLSFIQKAIAPGQMLMLAAQYESNDGQLFQTVYSLTHEGVKNLYFKQHAVPCMERMPSYLQSWPKAYSIFKAEQSFSSAISNEVVGFCFAGKRIIPRVCSDFFLVTTVIDLITWRYTFGKNCIVTLHVNDSWFVKYMRDLLKHVAHMRAWIADINLLYVDCGI